MDQAVEAELSQHRQEQESPGQARAEGMLGGQGEGAAIGDGRRLGARGAVVAVAADRSPAWW